MELGRGKVYLKHLDEHEQLIGDAEGLRIDPDKLEFKNFSLGSVVKRRNVTIALTGLEYSFKNLKKAMPEVFRAMRQLNPAISTAMGRKPFYKRRRTRSMRGK